jgi:hypothetical protein
VQIGERTQPITQLRFSDAKSALSEIVRLFETEATAKLKPKKAVAFG